MLETSTDGAFGSGFLRWDVRGRAAWLTIDRPETKNAMSLEMYRGVRRAVEAAGADDAISVVVITGVGDSFCAGGGLKAEVLFEDPTAWPGLGFVPSADGSFREADSDGIGVDVLQDVVPFDAILATPTTVIASVNGFCTGGGFGIALAADITVASASATFWVPELQHGVPDPWISAMLPAFVGLERAKYLMFTAQRLGSQRACEWGLVSEVVPDSDLRSRTDQIVTQVLSTAPVARGICKEQANRHLVAHDIDVLRDAASEAEKVEGVRAFVARRRPYWAT